LEAHGRFERKFSTARNNLILVVALTIVNIFLASGGSDLHFLFSANIPMMLFYFFYYINFALGIILALAATSIYAICWFHSRRNGGWIVAALKFFAIDGLFLLLLLTYGGSNVSTVLEVSSKFCFVCNFSVIIDIAFYAWIMFYLIIGARAWHKLKAMPPDYDLDQGQAYTVNSNN